MKELFKKYNTLMREQKIELIDEVFTKKFIKSSGGKKELIKKVKSLSLKSSLQAPKFSWRKGLKGEIYFAKMTVEDDDHSSKRIKKHEDSSTQFLIIEEEGKLKIDSTLSDDDD